MHLTQLRLDPRSALARRDLADPYDMHRTLVRAFVQDDRQVPPRFLWRLEPTNSWAEPTVLVQSMPIPDWSFLQSVRGYLHADHLPQTKRFDPAALLTPNGRCRFRLVANPTVTRDGKRHGLVGEEAQIAWLHRQGERCGFAIEAAIVSASGILRSRKGEARVSLRSVCFDGALNVRDPRRMAPYLAEGIGPGKAFGCGLLSLARL
jgi:CRISPR system Cascade subunit CasE